MDDVIELIKSGDERIILYIGTFFLIRYFVKEVEKRDKIIIDTVRKNTRAFNYLARALSKNKFPDLEENLKELEKEFQG